MQDLRSTCATHYCIAGKKKRGHESVSEMRGSEWPVIDWKDTIGDRNATDKPLHVSVFAEILLLFASHSRYAVAAAVQANGVARCVLCVLSGVVCGVVCVCVCVFMTVNERARWPGSQRNNPHAHVPVHPLSGPWAQAVRAKGTAPAASRRSSSSSG